MTNNYHLHNCNNYNPHISTFIKDNNSHNKANLLEDYVILDTETSNNHDNDNLIGWVYQWAFIYGNELVYGRTPTQLCNSLHDICVINNCDSNNKLLCYVHNLSYDFSYLVQYLQAVFGKPIKIFATAPHKVFSIEYDTIIFRCTYKLSNKSLDRWSKDLNTPHKKLVGAIDYDIIRYQDTPLRHNDWRYMFYDVIVLKECIEQQLFNYDDTIMSIPLTSTGYVRREIRRAYKTDSDNFKKFQKAKLNIKSYTAYRNEFSGGITHGNRHYSNKTIDIDMMKTINSNATCIRHRDFVSHYPSQQRVQQFPMGKTMLYYRIKPNSNITLNEIFELTKTYCVQVKILISELRLKTNKITLPYAQSSHFKREYSKGTHFIEDNGRILVMHGKAIVYLNEIDLYWINRQYDFQYCIYEVYICKKDKLPDFMIDTIDEHFKAKTDLKNVVRELKDNSADELLIYDNELNLMKSKNLLNGIYGCTATDIVREDIELQDIKYVKKPITSQYIRDSIDKYYKSRNNYNRYEWGCYTTAYARNELMQLYEIIGAENYIYCDTDSIFYISTPAIEQRIEEWNTNNRKLADINNYYITADNGSRIYYNQFADEKENITAFRFLHSKCYAYECDNKLKCVIAGVTAYSKNKKVSRETELADINNLTYGFMFTKCGGTITKYTNTPKATIDIEGHSTEVGTAAVIQSSTKTLKPNDDLEIYYKYAIAD